MSFLYLPPILTVSLARTPFNLLLLRITQKENWGCLCIADDEACLLLQSHACLQNNSDDDDDNDDDVIRQQYERHRLGNVHVFDHLWSHWVTTPEVRPGGNSDHILFSSYWEESPLGWNWDLVIARVQGNDTSSSFLLYSRFCLTFEELWGKNLNPHPQFIYRYVWGVGGV